MGWCIKTSFSHFNLFCVTYGRKFYEGVNAHWMQNCSTVPHLPEKVRKADFTALLNSMQGPQYY